MSNCKRTFCFSYLYDCYTDPYTERFGGGTGPILLDEVQCVGSEDSLMECGHAGIGVHNCFRFEDAGVQCLTGDPSLSL